MACEHCDDKAEQKSVSESESKIAQLSV